MEKLISALIMVSFVSVQAFGQFATSQGDRLADTEGLAESVLVSF